MPRIARHLLVLAASLAAVAGVAGIAEANTLSTAYAVSTTHHVTKNWNVKVVSSDRNANTEVANANMFNDPPKTGYQYVLVKVKATKLTSGTGNAFWDLGYKLYGRSTKHLYSTASEVAPNDMMDQDDVLKGGSDTGNVLFMVKKADISAGGLKLVVDYEYSFNNTNTWFRIA